MEVLEISSLCETYKYATNIEQKIKEKKQDFGFVNFKQNKGTPKTQRNGKI